MDEAPTVEQGIVSGTAANTPSEIRGEATQGRPVGSFGGTAANTPSEISGGLIGGIAGPEVPTAAEVFDRHQRI